jgi:hypothetical protein
MPTFDVTEKAVDFAVKSIKDMAGNPGQTVLIDKLPKQTDGSVLVNVGIGLDASINISAESTLEFRSNHPEAIEIILDKADQYVELFTRQAEIPGPWSLEEAEETGNWKVVGWDQ